ncbi:sugar nucleotide-binding protein [Pseudonocardia sp. MCCB 268]|nr:sugar nucleotide-binding protein [Pseudonocardia cytotoxica]
MFNAAAYTAVDRAETEPAAAWRVNARSGPALSPPAAARHGVTLVHVSTSTSSTAPCQPDAQDTARAARRVRRLEKAAGELAVRARARHLVAHASWVVGDGDLRRDDGPARPRRGLPGRRRRPGNEPSDVRR